MLLLPLLLALSVGDGHAPAVEPTPCRAFAEVENDVSAECGFLRVPERREDPKSRLIGVPFAIVHPTVRSRRDPIFFFTGGPGNRAIPKALRPHPFEGRDLVLLEQRGTALARPALDCPGYAAQKARALRGEISEAQLSAGLVEVAKTCVERARRAGTDLRGYTTREMVQDVEDLRRLKSYGPINLIGLSYSGKIVSEYARDFPATTRAVVANTPLSVEANYDEYAPDAVADSLGKVFKTCRVDHYCATAYGDLKTKYSGLLESADAAPLTVSMPDPEQAGHSVSIRVTKWVLANAVADQLYDAQSIEFLPRRIDHMAAGDLTALTAILDVTGSPYPWLMRIAVWCNEEAPFENMTRVRVRTAARGELGGVGQSTLPPGLCEAVGLPAVAPASENEAVKSRAPFLIFSGGYDPATPSKVQAQMAKGLPHAKLVIFPAASHGAGFSPCGNALVKSFLDDPSAALDIRCAAGKAVPAFQ